MRTISLGGGLRWNIAALISWIVAVGVVIGRAALLPHRAVMLKLYEAGGQHWLSGEPIYQNGPLPSFIYGPTAAAFFGLLLSIPADLRPAIWLLFDAAVFLTGVSAIIGSQLYRDVGGRYTGLILILLLPLILGNLDMSQANPFVIGLLMVALAGAWCERWNLAAVSIAVATCFKLYPIVVGLLLVLIAPRKFSWRLLIAVMAGALLPFLLQAPAYVLAQYHSWFATRVADNRFSYPITMAPIDLWLLLVRLGGLHLTPEAYRVIQVVGGGAVACLCLLGVRKEWTRRRLLIAVFSLACIWMTLLGPVTEGLTYAILAPAVVFAAVETYVEARPRWLQFIVLASLALLLLAVAKDSLAPHLFGIWTRALQPIAALLFLGYCLPWLLLDNLWPATSALG